MNIAKELKKMHCKYLENIPKETLENILSEASQLAKKKINEKVLKVGDALPEFNLKNTNGDIINSNDLLKKGPLVIKFYKGYK